MYPGQSSAIWAVSTFRFPCPSRIYPDPDPDPPIPWARSPIPWRSAAAPGSKSNPIPTERDPACPLTPELSIPEIPPPDVLPIDIPCKDTEVGDVPADNYTYNQSDKRDEAIQSRSDSGTNPEKPYSLNHMEGPADLQEPMHPCPDTLKEAAQQCKMDSRNPITGLGLNGDGVGGLKPKKQKNRGGRWVLEVLLPILSPCQFPCPLWKSIAMFIFKFFFPRSLKLESGMTFKSESK